MSWAMAIGASVSLTVGLINNHKAKKKAKEEESKANKAKEAMAELEASRPPVIDNSAKIRAMKDELSNPAANLGVATEAAEQQMAQTDQALANTLDTVRATGGGAGGATALAQAAAQSKAGVTADIQKQEASNEKARAQGEASLQKQKASIEGAAIAEEAAAYERGETRDIAKLNRLQSEIEASEGAQMAYEQQGDAALAEGFSSAGSAVGGMDFGGG